MARAIALLRQSTGRRLVLAQENRAANRNIKGPRSIWFFERVMEAIAARPGVLRRSGGETLDGFEARSR